jgi:EAL domain-containing protein (putative c-di-GMP-specific phosphodiesterase class I)
LEPEHFLGLADESGLAARLDEYVQRQAFRDVAAWRAEGYSDLTVSVNVSALQIEQEDFLRRFGQAIDAAGLAGSAVTVDVTESTLLKDIEAVVPCLRGLRRMDVRVAIDDFGTGYSSLSYLHQFPITSLKVDRSFVGDIREDQSGSPVVDAIVAMAGGLRLAVVAEGVENRVQLRYLVAHGCSIAQGQLFSAPVPAAELARQLAQDPYRALVAGAVLEQGELIDV